MEHVSSDAEESMQNMVGRLKQEFAERYTVPKQPKKRGRGRPKGRRSHKSPSAKQSELLFNPLEEDIRCVKNSCGRVLWYISSSSRLPLSPNVKAFPASVLKVTYPKK
jgi:hypothetical protein